jgi:hypothetical protein
MRRGCSHSSGTVSPLAVIVQVERDRFPGVHDALLAERWERLGTAPMVSERTSVIT